MYLSTHTHIRTAAATSTEAISATTTVATAGASAKAVTTTKAAEAAATEVKKCESGVYKPQIPYGTVPYRAACFVFFLRFHVNYLFLKAPKKLKMALFNI